MPTIYALTGTGASGKTTLFDELRRIHGHIHGFVPESARLYYQENEVPKEHRYLYDNQAALLKRFIDDLDRVVERNHEIIFTDSSALSCLVYAMLGSDEGTTKKLAEHIVPHLSRYTLFLLLDPSNINYTQDPEDPIRVETENQRTRIHEHLLSVLDTYSLPRRIISGTLDERIKQIIDSTSLNEKTNV